VKLTETPARKSNYRKWKIPILIAALTIIASLILLLVWVYYIVPSAYGDQFVSFSFELDYIAGPGNPAMEVSYINGSVVPVIWIGLWVNVTNSYVVPVEVRYNGFEFVWLIYNQTVTDPEDVIGNKDFLVWGTFRAAYGIGGWGWGIYSFDDWSELLGNTTGYEYYIARKDLSNYTETFPVGTYRDYAIYELFGFPFAVWYGQNLHGQPVSPGTYYNYFIAYGKVSQLINLTVTSVLWSR
jgi:hypothetical protein